MNPLRRWPFFFLLLAMEWAPVWGDELKVGTVDGGPDRSADLPVSVANVDGSVGVQFDLVYPETQVTALAASAASETTDHEAFSRKLTEEGRRRVVVHSPKGELLPSSLILKIPLRMSSDTPEGGPIITVESVIFTNNEGNPLPATITLPAIDNWRRENFTEAELLDPDIVGDDKDPDGDKMNNLWELVTGSNPTVADSSEKPPVINYLTEDGKRYTTFSFDYDSTKSDAVRVEAEASVDLKTWVPDDSNADVPPASGPDPVIQLELRVEWLESEPRRFMRLVVRRATD